MMPESGASGPTQDIGGGLGGVDTPNPSQDGYVYTYDIETRDYVRIPLSGAGSPDPKVVYRYTLSPACTEARPVEGVNCAAASTFCVANGQVGLHEDVWRSDVDSGFTNWSIVGDLCTGTLPAPIPTQQIVDDASEYERDHMPPGVPHVQPAGVAIVNIPVLASVTPLPQQVMAVQLPVPGQLVATATYTWTFDDGTTLTGPGIAYDGTDPRTDPNHYIAHNYTAAQANASVALTVTWNTTFTAADQTITIPRLVMPPITTTYSVHEAHYVLVSG